MSTTKETASKTTLRRSTPSQSLIPSIRQSKALLLALASAAALLIIAIVFTLVWPRLHTPSTRPLHLVVAGLQNSTPDPQFDQTLRTALIADLRQSPHLLLTPEDRIVSALVKINTAAAERTQASHVIPQQLCSQLKGDAYLTGELRRIGQKYLLSLSVHNCTRGNELATIRGIAGSPEYLLSVLDRAALSLRGRLGESRLTLDKLDQPFFPAGSASMPALKAYTDGAALALDGRSREAISLLQQAISIDSHFALAEEKLGLLQFSVGEAAEAAAHLARAHQLRDLANPYDRFLIEAHYNNLVTGDLSAALRTAREAVELYPDSSEFLINLANLEDKIGKSALALDPARRAIALDPGNPAAYELLAASQMHLGQLEEAALTCRLAIRRAVDTAAIHSLLLQIAFQRLDQPGIEEQIAWVQGKPEETAILVDQAWMELAQGQANSAQRLFSHAFTALRQQGAVENANLLEAALARRLVELGLADAAKAQLSHLQHPADYPDAAIAWAEIGETSRASSLLAEALAAHPSSSLLQQLQAPQVRAAIALNQHNPQQALDALQTAQYDRASFDIPLMRGRALLALHRPQPAETEFHAILDHPGLDPLSQDYPLAQLGLARALAAEGKITEAGFPYKIVLQIWKDADSDLPRLHDARSEYARLNGAPVAALAQPHRRRLTRSPPSSKPSPGKP